ncbi:MAG TPA: DUF3347 domain-containing protein [Candidatus Scalindua sp.]|nr:DUF3347 domain-containing protein [Candidatus Scalindua sp.]
MKKPIYYLAVIAVIFTACKNQASQDKKTDNLSEVHSEEEHSHDQLSNKTDDDNLMTTAINEGEKTKDLTLILDGYLQLKNALVSDNSQEASKAGQQMLSAFKGFDKSSLTETQKNKFLEIEEAAVENAEHILGNAGNIDHQREHFEILSIDVNDLITLIGTDKHLYQDFCPMYNDGKGAIWLSETKEIKNPFLGSKMLSCGEIQKEIN